MPAYKTVEPIIRQCFIVRLLGISGYKTLSYIPICSVECLRRTEGASVVGKAWRFWA